MEISKIKIPGRQDPIDIKDTVARQKSIEITWADLKDLRDNSQLIPGQWYRITDYLCTTVQTNTQSAGHTFDIIVRADAANALNENAYAARHAGDTYFANSKVEAWKLSYCLDNDTSRFVWAGGKYITIGSTNFSRDKANDVSSSTRPYCWASGNSDGGALDKIFTESETPSAGDNAYTSSTGRVSYTISSVNEKTGKGVIYRMIDEFNNDIPYDFKNIMFKWTSAISTSGIVANVFYYTISLVSGTNDATVTDHSLNGAYCSENKIERYYIDGLSKQILNKIVFRNINATSKVFSNSFVYNCKEITFNDFACGNNFTGCQHQYLGTSAMGNIFYCCGANNVCGNYFSYNYIGSLSGDNKFGNNVYNCHIGNLCEYIIFGSSASSLKSYCLNITVHNYNKRLYINCSATTSDSKFFRNIIVGSMINDSLSSYKTITHTTTNDTFVTEYKRKNSKVVSVN